MPADVRSQAKQSYWQGYNLDSAIRHKSSSGGAFWALASAFYDRYEDGCLYGCVLDDRLLARHVRATNIEGCSPMRGSKYVESELGDTFKMVADDLANGRGVLFTGTPCQAFGLQCYLESCRVGMDELLRCEVACHGVASPRFFRSYVAWQEERHGAKAKSLVFRAKQTTGVLQDMRIEFENGRIYSSDTTNTDWFYSAYHSNYILRESCYKCPFACRERFADITLADAWGVTEYSDGGISLIVANTSRGRDWITSLGAYMHLEEVQWEDVHQNAMTAPPGKPDRHAEAWSAYRSSGFLSMQCVTGANTARGRAKAFVIHLAAKCGLLSVARSLRRCSHVT